MNRTDALLARANQYVRAGTAGFTMVSESANRTNTANSSRRDAKSKADEDEVEAYLKSLTLGGTDEPVKSKPIGTKGNSSLPLPASHPLSGRGRSFLKTRENSNENMKTAQKTETIQVPLSSKEPVRSRSMSSSSYSSASPPLSPVRRATKPVAKKSTDSDIDEDAEDDRLVAEQFRRALKTTGSLGLGGTSGEAKQPPAKEKPTPANPPKEKATTQVPRKASVPEPEPLIVSSSYVDDSGNVIYSLTFDEDDEADPTQDAKEPSERSYADDVDDEDESPINMAMVVQSVDELLSGPAIDNNRSFVPDVPESRPGTANSMASIAESIESRPASVASTDSAKSVAAGGYSDDFDESSQSYDHRKLPELPRLAITRNTTAPVVNSARSVEAHSVTTTQNVDESIAPLSESLGTDDSVRRRRAMSYDTGQTLKLHDNKYLTVPSQPKRASPRLVRYDRVEEEKPKPAGRPTGPAPTYQPTPTAEPTANFFQNMFPFQQMQSGAPIVLMFPPQSFFANLTPQMMQPPQQPQPTFGDAARQPQPQHQQQQQAAPLAQHQGQSILAQHPPSVYLPFFLERSTTRTLIAQCRMLTESINATRMAYERRMASASMSLNARAAATSLK